LSIAEVLNEVNGKTIYAPMMGMFYRAPSPGAAPFVEVGDTITEHTIIGIIEVMKVMSSIEAGVKGKVSSILVENGQLVEYNQPLFLIDHGE
jgi:acetyl-CoA carboxylase biotin carboxyl carrier protein